jgi:tRNA nucleotidyltransferase/poly(A) polymerase
MERIMKATSEYIIEKLCSNKFETYIVGGVVRDLLLEIEPKDEDIVTSATPNEIMELFKGHEIKTVGKSFNVVLIDGIEIATFRIDKYSGLSDKNVKIEIAKTMKKI